tara:strand:+ start:1188 stop:1856 length:669 start_codon:yes stop_codon:yes gene_type:complete
MAIAYGLAKYSNQNPSGNSQTLGVTCTNGTDKGLFIVVTMANTVNFSSATYNGTAMTLIGNQNYGTLSQRQCGFWLANPDSGSQYNFVVNFSGNQWNSTSIMAQSLTGISQTTTTNHASNGLTSTLHTRSITIGANDIIYISGISTQAQPYNYEIPTGTAVTNPFAHNTNKQVEGAWSGLSLSAGATNVSTRSGSGTISNHRWAFGSAGGGTGSSRRRIIIT